MWRNNVKLAIRSLYKNSLFTAINVLGLTIGMTATLLIYVWVQHELTFDGHYQHANTIHRILCHWKGEGETININSIPIRLKEIASEKIPEMQECYLLRPDQRSPLVKLKDGTVFEEKEFAYVNKPWFEAFDYQVLEGSIEAFNADKYSIALTKSQAEKYFGTASALGQQLEIYSTIYTVKLLLKENPPNSSLQFKAYLPLESFWKDQAAYEEDYNSGNFNYIAFFKTDQATNTQKIATQLADILNETDEENRNLCSIIPLKGMRFNQDIPDDYFPHQNKAAVYLFAIIGLIILLTAGLNYLNLSTALISRRAKEFGIKKVIGANVRQVFSQIILEPILMSLLAFFAAIGIAQALLPSLSRFVETPLQLQLTDPSVCLALIGIVLLNVLVAGTYPAYLSASFKPVQLVSGEKVAGKGVLLRKVLVVAQFASVVIVLISTLVIYQQLLYVQQKNVGYSRDQVIKIRPNMFRTGDIARNFDQFALFKQELEKLLDFESVALTDASVSEIDNQNSGGLNWEGKPKNLLANVYQFGANEGLRSVFDLQLEDGRWFSPDFTSDAQNIILNETAVRRFQIPEPVIGRKASFHGKDGQIIGVVKDFNFRNLHEAIEPLVIWHNEGRGHTILARIQGDNTVAALAKAEEKFASLLPGIPFNYTFIEETFQKMHQADAKMGTLFQIFACLLVFISCLGLFGLAVFATELRVKEIGIRKVLGASVSSIVSLLSKDFLKLVVIAVLVAVPIAWYFMDQWLQEFAYRISLQWWMFAAAGLLAVLVAFLTVSFQSVKAALANPVRSLRSE